MADLVPVQIGGGRNETLLILGALGVGALILWRRGAFAAPVGAPPPLPPPPGAPPAGGRFATRPRRVMETPQPTSSALTTPAPDPARAAALQQHLITTGAGTGASSGLAFKPAPVTAPPGVIGSASVNVPSPFGRKPAVKVVTQAAYNATVANLSKPAPVAAPPAPAPPKPAPLVTPLSAAAASGGAFGAFRPASPLARPAVAGASFAAKAAAPAAPAPAAKPGVGSALNPKRFFG